MGNRFQAAATTDPATLVITSGGRTMRIPAEELLAFWQQLRDFGLTHGSIAPEHRFVSYLLPVFAALPYVEPVQVSASSAGLRQNPAAGVQIVPPPRPTAPATRSLFAGPGHAAQG